MNEELGASFARLLGPRIGKVVAYGIGIWVVTGAVSSSLELAQKVRDLLPGYDLPPLPPWVLPAAGGFFVGIASVAVFLFLVAVRVALKRASDEQPPGIAPGAKGEQA